MKKVLIYTKNFIVISITLCLLSLGFLSALSHGKISLASGKDTINLSLRKSTNNVTLTKNGINLPSPKDVFFVLVIGNDERPGVEGARADALHLLGINPTLKKVSIINFPRDTNVPIPGYGKNKINAANAFGGSELTTQTVEQLSGVKITYVLETNFAGFTTLIDSLGGLQVTIEKSMKDKNSGTDFSPGTIIMGGADALAFSRDRHSFSDGDISRSYNQGQLLIYALREMQNIKSSTTNKFEAVFAISKNVKLTNLSLSDLFYLMELANEINLENVINITVPWSGANTLAPKATDLFNDLKDNGVIDTYVP